MELTKAYFGNHIGLGTADRECRDFAAKPFDLPKNYSLKPNSHLGGQPVIDSFQSREALLCIFMIRGCGRETSVTLSWENFVDSQEKRNTDRAIDVCHGLQAATSSSDLFAIESYRKRISRIVGFFLFES